MRQSEAARDRQHPAQNKLPYRRDVRSDNYQACHQKKRWKKRRKSGGEYPKLILSREKNRQDRQPETNRDTARPQPRSAKQKEYPHGGQPATHDREHHLIAHVPTTMRR